jgi:hypothetical protein
MSHYSSNLTSASLYQGFFTKSMLHPFWITLIALATLYLISFTLEMLVPELFLTIRHYLQILPQGLLEHLSHLARVVVVVGLILLVLMAYPTLFISVWIGAIVTVLFTLVLQFFFNILPDLPPQTTFRLPEAASSPSTGCALLFFSLGTAYFAYTSHEMALSSFLAIVGVVTASVIGQLALYAWFSGILLSALLGLSGSLFGYWVYRYIPINYGRWIFLIQLCSIGLSVVWILTHTLFFALTYAVFLLALALALSIQGIMLFRLLAQAKDDQESNNTLQ